MELSKYNPSSSYTTDHSTSLQAAAVESLTQQYPQGPYVSERSPSAESGQRSNSRPRPRPVTDDENDELALGVGMLSLSGLGDPLYLGASSGVNWARVCATYVHLNPYTCADWQCTPAAGYHHNLTRQIRISSSSTIRICRISSVVRYRKPNSPTSTTTSRGSIFRYGLQPCPSSVFVPRLARFTSLASRQGRYLP